MIETALLVGLVVAIVAALLMNRGNPWFLNVKAQDEPIVVGIGAGIAMGAPKLADLAGGETVYWVVLGVAMMLGGVAVWKSDEMDIFGLI